MKQPTITETCAYFMDLQDRLCLAFEQSDGQAQFSREELSSPEGSSARPRVLSEGAAIEKAAVQFTHSKGARLPPAATERNPALADQPFEAASISAIVHPRNPYAPIAHLNLRMFLVTGTTPPLWYFGGGFDLTPCYGFEEDAVHFHQMAKAACQPFGEQIYPRLKEQCDQYFFLTHRQEPRGIGGLFFDDWTEGGFAHSLAFVKSVGEHFPKSYLPLLERRKDMPYTQLQRDFQLYRRGRYAEFNLVIDRGTKYGLQSGRRVESVLASLPPLASWKYNWQPEEGSVEERLYQDFLHPRDWAQTLDVPK